MPLPTATVLHIAGTKLTEWRSESHKDGCTQFRDGYVLRRDAHMSVDAFCKRQSVCFLFVAVHGQLRPKDVNGTALSMTRSAMGNMQMHTIQ